MAVNMVSSKFDDIFDKFATVYILTQKTPLVVLDDGLSDEIKAKYRQFTYLDSSKDGDGYYHATATINKGVEYIAPNDYVMMCDDVYLNTLDLCEQLERIAYQEDIAGYVAPVMSNVWNHLQWPCNRVYDEKGYTILDCKSDAKYDNYIDLVPICGYLKRSVVEAVGSWDESYTGYGEFSDLDYSIRIRLAGFRHIVAQYCFAEHGAPHFPRRGNNTISRIDWPASYREQNKDYFEQKWNL